MCCCCSVDSWVCLILEQHLELVLHLKACSFKSIRVMMHINYLILMAAFSSALSFLYQRSFPRFNTHQIVHQSTKAFQFSFNDVLIFKVGAFRVSWWILHLKGFKESSQHTAGKHQFFGGQPTFMLWSPHIRLQTPTLFWVLGCKSISSLNTHIGLSHSFLQKDKHLSFLQLQSNCSKFGPKKGMYLYFPFPHLFTERWDYAVLNIGFIFWSGINSF